MYTQSMDSEISYFEPSTTSTNDSLSGYFGDWEGHSRDSYCPQIASWESPPTKPKSPDASAPELLPTACPRPQRPASMRRDAELDFSSKHTSHRSSTASSKTKRYGIVPHASPTLGEEAAARLDNLLRNSLSNTEDILAAMYNPNWDVASLQKWYKATSQSSADLALFKIIFSLRYTHDEPSPLG